MKFELKIVLVFMVLILSNCKALKESKLIENESVKINMINAFYYNQDVKNFQSNVDGHNDENNLFSTFSPDLVLNWKAVKITDPFYNDSKSYMASYSVKNSYNDFFDPKDLDLEKNSNYQESIPNDLLSFNYVGFEVIRLIREETVSRIRLDFELNHSRKFIRINPSSLLINKTKVRLLKKDNNIDLELNIIINSSWIDKNGVFQNIELLNSNISIDNIVIGKYYCNLKICDYKELLNEIKIENNNSIFDKSSEWFPLMPVSINNNKRIGNGNFTIQVIVIEVDDHKEKVNKNKELNKNNQSEFIKGLQELSN